MNATAPSRAIVTDGTGGASTGCPAESKTCAFRLFTTMRGATTKEYAAARDSLPALLTGT